MVGIEQLAKGRKLFEKLDINVNYSHLKKVPIMSTLTY